MSCPWANIKKPEPINFQEIMSEEMAKDLQAKGDKKFLDSQFQEPLAEAVVDIPVEVLEAVTAADDTVQSDEMIARMLQMQYDKEYDEALKKSERQLNKSSRISVSFDNYRRTPLNDDFESDPEDEEIVDILDRKDWDRFDTLAREEALMPPCGYRMQPNGKMVTKHDAVMNGIKNAGKLLLFPPEFHTGDGENFNLKLSNKVFNSLKTYSSKEQSRRYKMHDKKEDRATAEFGLDEFTRMLLYKMIVNELLERVNGVISIGKEAVVLHADSDQNCPNPPENFPKECVIKVFKTTLSEFKQRDKYIKDDYRFKDRIGRQTTRKTISLWAEKEMANLMRLKKAGIPCPQVVALKQHVLVMSFIGENNKPAPKLKDGIHKFEDFVDAYEQVINLMKSLYENARLVHADLSEYNVLWHKEQCYFIDVSQAVDLSHENAFAFLMRDCTNIVKFFTKKKVETISNEELFKWITGLEYGDKLAQIQVQEAFKMKPHLVDKPGVESSNNFEAIWEKITNADVTSDVVEQGVSDISLKEVEPPKA